MVVVVSVVVAAASVVVVAATVHAVVAVIVVAVAQIQIIHLIYSAASTAICYQWRLCSLARWLYLDFQPILSSVP